MQKNNWKAFTEITIIDDLTIFHFEFHNITYKSDRLHAPGVM